MATKSFEVMGAMQTLRMFGEVAQLDQRMLKTLDNVSPDKLFREVWYANSSSMNALKSLDEVEKEREEMKAKFEEQQQIKQLPALADAAQKMSGSVQPDSLLGEAQEDE